MTKCIECYRLSLDGLENAWYFLVRNRIIIRLANCMVFGGIINCQQRLAKLVSPQRNLIQDSELENNEHKSFPSKLGPSVFRMLSKRTS